MQLNIKPIRERLGISQLELAKRSKLTPAYINNLESGVRTNPSSEVLIRLAEALETTTDELLGLHDQTETAKSAS